MPITYFCNQDNVPRTAYNGIEVMSATRLPDGQPSGHVQYVCILHNGVVLTATTNELIDPANMGELAKAHEKDDGYRVLDGKFNTGAMRYEMEMVDYRGTKFYAAVDLVTTEIVANDEWDHDKVRNALEVFKGAGK